jgi:hypothetical protein
VNVQKALILLTGGLFLLPVACFCQTGNDFFGSGDRASWSWDLTAGVDSYLHTYALALEDTSEALAEFLLQAGIQGRSARNSHHRWRLRGEASNGTELWRERLEGDYSFLDGNRITRFRLLGHFWGRQYKKTTEYNLSSDNFEGRLEGRTYPWVTDTAALDIRAWGGFIDYKTPSTLEVDYKDAGLGVFLRSRTLGNHMWGGGVRGARRAYPDSSEIDRNTWSVEADYDYQDLSGQGVRLFHKSDRRLIADETVRPSAWTHWTDFQGLVSAGAGHVYLEAQSEMWNYDQETDVYFNSWRIETALGYQWGDILKAVWKASPVLELMEAGDSPEAYTQLGIRTGVESYGSAVGGSITLEYGRRDYNQGDVVVDDGTGDLEGVSTIDLYSDFNYWKIWLLGSWQISQKFSLDFLANYEPENHTENTDDAAIGFASLHLIWRP